MTSTTRSVLAFLASAAAPLTAVEIALAVAGLDGRAVSTSLVSLHASGLLEPIEATAPGKRTRRIVTWQINDRGQAAAKETPK